MISVKGLTKRYCDALVVDDLTFEALPGRVTGFLGPNGAVGLCPRLGDFAAAD